MLVQASRTDWIAVRSIDDAQRLRVVELRPPLDAEDAFETWVATGATVLVEHLRQTFDENGFERCAVLVAAPHMEDPRQRAAAEALLAAVRGIVGSITLELRERARVNAIFAADLESDAVRETLELLAGPFAGFVAGSTFDLRERS